MRPNDGGESAFPRMTYDDPRMAGMSLRDYFAGQALAALLTEEYTVVDDDNVVKRDRRRIYDVDDPEQASTVAYQAYQMADAMLAERAK